jgi:hypothetical protein
VCVLIDRPVVVCSGRPPTNDFYSNMFSYHHSRGNSTTTKRPILLDASLRLHVHIFRRDLLTRPTINIQFETCRTTRTRVNTPFDLFKRLSLPTTFRQCPPLFLNDVSITSRTDPLRLQPSSVVRVGDRIAPEIAKLSSRPLINHYRDRVPSRV